MSEPKQLSLLNTSQARMTLEQIEYVMPDSKLIDKYAQEIYRGGSGKVDIATVRDFSTFLKLVMKIKTDQLNKENDHAA